MAYSYSDDGGNTFSKAKTISPDNWSIEGCPHTGPSLAVDGQGLHAIWFTAGGGPGVYYAHSTDDGNTFHPRVEVSKAARYPQQISIQDGTRILVWAEATAKKFMKQADVSSGHQHRVVPTPPAKGTKIMLRQESKNQSPVSILVSDKEARNASHPVIASVNQKKVLVAWTQGEGDTGVFYKVVNLPR